MAGCPESPNLQSQTLSGILRKAWSLRNVLNSTPQGCRIPDSGNCQTQSNHGQNSPTHTRNGVSVSFPPCSNFRNVGLLLPRMFWSMGSSVLIVLDSGLHLTIHTSTFPRHTPTLKNAVCDDILFARLRPAIGSVGSSASSGNVITCRSLWPIRLCYSRQKQNETHLITQ
jgi:hypothetical protein